MNSPFQTINELLRLEFEIASARDEGVSGHFDGARAKLENVLHRAHARNLVGIEFESRLALAEVEQRVGQKAHSHVDLLALEKNARAVGFGLIAANASHLLEADAKPGVN